MFAVFRGKRWFVKWVSPRTLKTPDGVQAHGVCDSPTTKNKKILFRNNFRRSRKEMEVFIHEALHACIWDLDEETVYSTAEDISKFLWRLGYRRTET